VTSLREFGSKLSGLFRKRSLDNQLEEEINEHLDLLIEENIRRGMSPQKAHLAARQDFGAIDLIKETYRDRRGMPMLETFLQDLRYGARTLRKNAGFTTVAVLTLALGIGANTAIFSIVNTVLIRPLPFNDPSRLVMLWEGLPVLGLPQLGFEAPDLQVLQRAQKSYEQVSAFQSKDYDISGNGEPERIKGTRVSASLFPMLGVAPAIGRMFTQDEDAPGQQVAILSSGLWQRRFGGDTSVIGRTVDLDRQPYKIVGVMRSDFRFPLPGPSINNEPADIFVPMGFTPTELKLYAILYGNSVIAKLKPGVSLAQARAENDSIARAILSNYPPNLMTKNPQDALTLPTIPLKISAVPLHEEVSGTIRPLLLILMASVGLVLLIACANVATLLISRAASRQKEIAIRASLGATRVRLLRQMITESLLLAFMGGVAGLALAFMGKTLLLTLVPQDLPLPQTIPIGLETLGFVALISCFAAVFFGLAPAFQLSSASLQRSLQEGGRSATPGRQRHRLQGIFVTAEFALALVLLIGAGLLVRSFDKILRTSPGFSPDNVLTLSLPLPYDEYNKAPQIRQFYDQLLLKASNLPGVKAVGMSNDLPMSGHLAATLEIEGITGVKGVIPKSTMQSLVLGNYFEVMSIPLMQGRYFTPEDRMGSQPVAIISLSLVRRYWQNENPLGKRVRWGGLSAPWQTIVGVVGDVNDKPLGQPVDAHAYTPYAQMADIALESSFIDEFRSLKLAVRTQADPAAMTVTVVSQVHSLDPVLAVANIHTMSQVVSTSVAGPRFNTILLAIFAGMALLLAAIGIYGVLAYIVTQQTHEIGIRVALGAAPGNVIGMVIGRGARMASLGAGIGVIAALALTRLMASLLYGVSPTDPTTFVGVVVVLVGVALLACFIPARRATQVDPLVALRHE
jgi:putative ABC transport system permease protein